jgi:glycosyltransferase involved in cell wall biosynthesis
MIFQEAKYLSVPVITTDFGSSREFITNGYDGVIAPLEIITDAIAKMMNSSEEYNKIKQAIGVSDYTNSIIAKSINELLS